jgi:hypothetical protein
VNRLRNRLILIFLAATLVPLAVTMWYTTSLLKLTSFRHTADQVDTLSQSLLRTSKELYQRDSADLKAHARNGGSLTTSRKATAWITWSGMTAMSGYIPPA